MTSPLGSNPVAAARGAVDLSSLGGANQVSPTPAPQAQLKGAYTTVIDATNFQEIIGLSAQFPVLVLLWMPTDLQQQQLKETLSLHVDELAGRMVLATLDVEQEAALAAQFQVQAFPTVVAVLGGQVVPLFQGTVDDEQLFQVLQQVYQAGVANGITGQATPFNSQTPDAVAPEEPLSPQHQRALEALEKNDLPEAIAAYEQALKENPRDDEAKAGLAQVNLLVRTQELPSAIEVRTAAAENPNDLQAALAVADLDFAGGKIEDAWGRLIELLAQSSDNDEREALRKRVLEYFEVVGLTDPRVNVARRQLTSALY